MIEMLVHPHGIFNAKNIPLVTVGNGDLAYQLKIDLSTFPSDAIREDAFQCGWLDISPYWRENYVLIVEKGVLKYSTNQRLTETLIGEAA